MRERERERVIRGERVMWERAVARQSTLSKRIDENLFLDKAAPCCFRFWGPSPSIFFGVHPSTRGKIGPMRAAHPRRFERSILNAHCVVQNRRARARLSHEPNARVVARRVFAETKFSRSKEKIAR